MCDRDDLVAIRLLPTWNLHHAGRDYGPGDVVRLEPEQAERVLGRGHAERV